MRRRLLFIWAVLAVSGAFLSPAVAFENTLLEEVSKLKVRDRCISVLFPPNTGVGRWAKVISEWAGSRANLAKRRMERLFQSTEGKIKGATKAAAIDPNHEYDSLWIRDNAINVKALSDRPDLIEAYLQFCRSNLSQDMSEIPLDADLPAAVREALRYINGEPKFNPNGSKFKKFWGRPQNDGPAYRALRWLEAIEKKIVAGDQLGAIRNYNPNLDKLSVKWDLEYLAHHWRAPSFDLWEEEMGTHFHTLAVMADALEKGAQIAEKLEPGGVESAAAKMYREQAKEIREKILAEAWDDERGYLRSVWKHDGGFVHKQEPLDIAVFIALIHRTTKKIFDFSDDKVMATMEAIERRFSEEFRYNRRFRMSIYRGEAALGRYLGDIYHGGNPWVIATQTAAEYYYRLGQELLGMNEIEITARNRKFFARLLRLNEDSPLLEVGRKIKKETGAYSEMIQAIQEKGDGYLNIIRSLSEPEGFHAEQFGRGYQVGDQGPWVANFLKASNIDGNRTHPGGNWIGAEMLVWNESSLVSAVQARDDLLSMMPTQ